jgi:hypothetical protein
MINGENLDIASLSKMQLTTDEVARPVLEVGSGIFTIEMRI